MEAHFRQPRFYACSTPSARVLIGLFRYIKIQLDSEEARTKTKESGWYVNIFTFITTCFYCFCPHCLTFKLNIWYFENGLFLLAHVSDRLLPISWTFIALWMAYFSVRDCAIGLNNPCGCIFWVSAHYVFFRAFGLINTLRSLVKSIKTAKDMTKKISCRRGFEFVISFLRPR